MWSQDFKIARTHVKIQISSVYLQFWVSDNSVHIPPNPPQSELKSPSELSQPGILHTFPHTQPASLSVSVPCLAPGRQCIDVYRVT